ncbi:MAG: hypothetical protein EB075_11460 [Bacteroidetes bacterium]|nr:hypothetical protein [Bacteroidota bacterium]
MEAMMKEEWRPIQGFDGRYDVSNHGRIRSWVRPGSPRGRIYRKTPRVLSPARNPQGYLRVCLRNTSGKHYLWVHRLVLEAFVGQRPNGFETGHRNGNPSDNHLANLAWVTPAENAADKVRHGTMARGEKVAHVMTEAKVREVFQLRGLGLTHRAIAKEVGVHHSTIGRILRREIWAHVEAAP